MAHLAYFIAGLLTFIAGFALFGLGFDVIDAPRAWRFPMFCVMPCLIAFAFIDASVILAGVALISAAFHGGTDDA